MRIGVILPIAAGPGQPVWGWGAIREFALRAEAAGVGSLWACDHLYVGNARETGSTHEAWGLLTAIAAVTTRVELGHLVSCVSFRDPGLTAKMAATVDEISGGRYTLGLGAGWYDYEYESFGFPTDHRYGRFAEALEIILPLLAGESVTFDGRWYRTRDARLEPPPPRRIPILIAGERPKMLSLVAAHADAWNTAWFQRPDARYHASIESIRTALADAGRDPATLRITVGVELSEDSSQDLAGALAEFAAVGADEIVVDLAKPTTDLDRLISAARPWLAG